ncbi:MAG: methenyltetrahydromethanopterin cyclohydrolase [Planctomycetota bacterium]|nr:methenyltetrahydromethanopterin cyclohydrolase [Planctomycetota bacterium]
MPALDLNQRAWNLLESASQESASLRIDVRQVEGGGRVVDCGVEAAGGLEAGLFLARLTLADLATVSLVPGETAGRPCPRVTVRTDQPVAACMASQYAGWQISLGDFFAMGSGPFRARHGKEELFDDIGHRESSDVAVGVLETRTLPGRQVFGHLAEKLGVEPRRLALAVAPTASLAGGVQVVARSVETALHKLHTLGFDLSRVVSGFGSAPLPPPAKGDLEALGRTNDAVLYGGRVNLWVRCDDDVLADVGPKVPSSSSRDHGSPFLETFERAGRDFYQIDPHLFSPAEIVFHNLDSGRSHHFGAPNVEVLRRSFFG